VLIHIFDLPLKHSLKRTSSPLLAVRTTVMAITEWHRRDEKPTIKIRPQSARTNEAHRRHHPKVILMTTVIHPRLPVRDLDPTDEASQVIVVVVAPRPKVDRNHQANQRSPTVAKTISHHKSNLDRPARTSHRKVDHDRRANRNKAPADKTTNLRKTTDQAPLARTSKATVVRTINHHKINPVRRARTTGRAPLARTADQTHPVKANKATVARTTSHHKINPVHRARTNQVVVARATHLVKINLADLLLVHRANHKTTVEINNKKVTSKPPKPKTNNRNNAEERKVAANDKHRRKTTMTTTNPKPMVNNNNNPNPRKSDQATITTVPRPRKKLESLAVALAKKAVNDRRANLSQCLLSLSSLFLFVHTYSMIKCRTFLLRALLSIFGL